MAEVKRLEKTFFMKNDVVGLAHDLIGKILVTNINDHTKSGIIVETEAYSYKEKACHAYNNKRTKRTETLFKEGGTVYVYLCYGIHHLFNIVSNIEGKAEAVLIRALQPQNGFSSDEINAKKKVASGPGKLSKAMGINIVHNNLSLLGNTIWIEDQLIDMPGIEKSKRIGVDYAAEDADLLWRFTAKTNKWISNVK